MGFPQRCLCFWALFLPALAASIHQLAFEQALDSMDSETMLRVLLADPHVDVAVRGGVALQVALFRQHRGLVELVLAQGGSGLPLSCLDWSLSAAASAGLADMAELLLIDGRARCKCLCSRLIPIEHVGLSCLLHGLTEAMLKQCLADTAGPFHPAAFRALRPRQLTLLMLRARGNPALQAVLAKAQLACIGVPDGRIQEAQFAAFLKAAPFCATDDLRAMIATRQRLLCLSVATILPLDLVNFIAILSAAKGDDVKAMDIPQGLVRVHPVRGLHVPQSLAFGLVGVLCFLLWLSIILN